MLILSFQIRKVTLIKFIDKVSITHFSFTKGEPLMFKRAQRQYRTCILVT